MGLLNIFKGNKKSSSSRQRKYEYNGYENLTDDYETLEQMFDYYQSLYRNNDFSGYEEERYHIAKKFKEVGELQIPYNPVNRGRFIYTLYFGTIEEQVAYYFDEFINRVKKTLIPYSALAQRKKAAKKDRSYLIDSYVYQHSGSSSLEHRFCYHDDENLSDEQIEDNKLVEYYESHMEELADVILELIERQNQGDMLLYTGYYMYIDLYNYLIDSEEHFSKKVWEKSHSYIEYCSSYYDGYLLYKLEHNLKNQSRVEGMNDRARRLGRQCDQEKLKLLSQNYLPSRKIMNIVNIYYKQYHLQLKQEEIKTIVNDIIDLSENIKFTTKQRNKIASVLYEFTLVYNDLMLCDKIISYLKDIENTGIKNESNEIDNVIDTIKKIEVRKREINKINNHLPAFSIVPIEVKLFNSKSSNIRYYDMQDGRQLIVTNVLTFLHLFTEGDILESIETGQQFELLSIRLTPKDWDDETDIVIDESEINSIEVQLACKQKYHLKEKETLVKIKSKS